MPSTLRFKGKCFRPGSDLSLGEIVAIRLRLNRRVPRPLAFEQHYELREDEIAG